MRDTTAIIAAGLFVGLISYCTCPVTNSNDHWAPVERYCFQKSRVDDLRVKKKTDINYEIVMRCRSEFLGHRQRSYAGRAKTNWSPRFSDLTRYASEMAQFPNIPLLKLKEPGMPRCRVTYVCTLSRSRRLAREDSFTTEERLLIAYLPSYEARGITFVNYIYRVARIDTRQVLCRGS